MERKSAFLEFRRQWSWDRRNRSCSNVDSSWNLPLTLSVRSDDLSDPARRERRGDWQVPVESRHQCVNPTDVCGIDCVASRPRCAGCGARWRWCLLRGRILCIHSVSVTALHFWRVQRIRSSSVPRRDSSWWWWSHLSAQEKFTVDRLRHTTVLNLRCLQAVCSMTHDDAAENDTQSLRNTSVSEMNRDLAASSQPPPSTCAACPSTNRPRMLLVFSCLPVFCAAKILWRESERTMSSVRTSCWSSCSRRLRREVMDGSKVSANTGSRMRWKQIKIWASKILM